MRPQAASSGMVSGDGEGRSAAASSTLRSALTGEQKGWFIVTSSIDPPLSPSAMAQAGEQGYSFFKKAGEKEAETS